MANPTGQFHSKTPPINGAFPLDHEGECKDIVKEYLACLKKNGSLLTPCRALAKRYFTCRMQNGLMATDDWSNLGFSGGGGDLASSSSSSLPFLYEEERGGIDHPSPSSSTPKE